MALQRFYNIFGYTVTFMLMLMLLLVFYNATPDLDGHNTHNRPLLGAAGDFKNQTYLDEDTVERLRRSIDCKNRSFEPRVQQRGRYWVLYNFVRAEHGPIGCHETVTYTTHGHYVFLDNLEPLLIRWMNPISVALFAPGDDFTATVDSIKYLRDCGKTDLVRKYATFHIYFPSDHMPMDVSAVRESLNETYKCVPPVPYVVDPGSVYKDQHNLLYPINVGRNVARDASLTHYVLPSDIELYPSPHLPEKFMHMIARDEPPLNNTNPRVFPLSIFEVEKNSKVPTTKTELVEMLRTGKAIPFHMRICSSCHSIPEAPMWKWINESDTLNVFHVAKRLDKFYHWEPIFIGTRDDPYYDERLSWEGMKDKMSQGYIFCVLDYDFMILDNAFLVHRPGIKTEVRKDKTVMQNTYLSKRVLLPELIKLFGTRKGCDI